MKVSKELAEQLKQVEALQVTVLEIMQGPTFKKWINAELSQQRELRKMARNVAKGRIPAHTVDRFMDISVDEFIAEAINVLAGVSKRPRREREYIRQLSKVAYDKAVKEIAIAEKPELAEMFEKNGN